MILDAGEKLLFCHVTCLRSLRDDAGRFTARRWRYIVRNIGASPERSSVYLSNIIPNDVFMNYISSVSLTSASILQAWAGMARLPSPKNEKQ
ncbi:hypothetical protein [Methylobacillus sp. MM3]|jgi:hypothetical protein|uniref:hypothetical protein n=1 Tax=Methylobacillus sp. MM3 TaxID=1848039 RepID=UPI0013F4E1D3|nr:hypothetical protein [Methylobacillus sp. MM3]